MLLLYAFGGRAVLGADPARRARPRRRARARAVLIATGVLMAFNVDVRFEEALAQGPEPAGVPDRPDALARDVERALRTGSPLCGHRRASPSARSAASPRASPVGDRSVSRSPACRRRSLPRPRPGAAVHRQPAVVQHAGRPAADARGPARACRARRLLDIHMHQLHPHAAVRRGSVRALPPLRARRRRRRDAGVHVRAERGQRPAGDRSDGITYPVVQDNRYGTWNAYQNEYWPAEYLIDADGEVRHTAVRRGRLPRRTRRRCARSSTRRERTCCRRR